MQLTLLLLLLGTFASVAHARPDAWSVEVDLRGTGSVAIGAGAISRAGAVPSLGVRTRRAFDRVHVGANLAAGFPAWYGQHELSLTAELVHTVREARCSRSTLEAAVECDARLDLSGGIDGGIAMLYFDAPPELSSSSNAVVYWGPLGRARVALRATWPMANETEIGVSIGGGLALASAHYTDPTPARGVRLEPTLEIGGVVGF